MTHGRRIRVKEETYPFFEKVQKIKKKSKYSYIKCNYKMKTLILLYYLLNN